MVPAMTLTKDTSPKGVMLFSTMQMEKSLQKGEETQLVTLKEDGEDGSDDDVIPHPSKTC